MIACTKTRKARSLSLVLLLSYIHLAHAVAQQTAASSENPIRAVIILARHGVRAPIASEVRRSAYNAQPWPAWPVMPGVLTQHGTDALKLLGAYYRLRYPSLLDGLSCNHPAIYAEANTTQRTIASARAMITAMVPDCNLDVHYRKNGTNPLFEPAPPSSVEQQQIADATMGRMANHPEWYANAFASPLATMYYVLSHCSGIQCSKNTPDFRTVTMRNGITQPRNPRTNNPVGLGADFAENFLLQYTEGLPMNQVGWGRVDRNTLNNLMEMNTQYHDFFLRTPYEAQFAASDLATRIRATILSIASGTAVAGQLGTQQDRLFLLDGHDSNISWLGGLLRLDWLVPDQTFNATPPGSALIFEIHRNTSTHRSTVQVFFVSQTLDQIRFLRPLTAEQPPSIAPIFVPGCSDPAPTYACSVKDFARVISAAVAPATVDR